MSKAIVFTVDVMMATVVLILAIATLSFVHQATTTQTEKFQTMNSAARDSMRIISEMTVGEAAAIPEIKVYIDNGTINATDLNKTLMDTVGSFWVSNQNGTAKALVDAALRPFLGDNLHYSIYFDDDLVSTNNNSFSSRVAASSVVSGYKVGEPISGYIARAWTTTVVGRERQIIDISPLGSGFGSDYGKGGTMTIVKKFTMPENATNVSAVLYMSIHEESGWINVSMNGVNQTIPSGNACNHPVGQCYDKINIYNITNGTNSLQILITRPSTYHSHLHPGNLLIIDYYNERDSSYYKEQSVSEKLNLTEVTGNPCVWETFPFRIPKNSVINSARLYLRLEGANDLVTVFANDASIYSNSSPATQMSLQFDIKPQLSQSSNYTPPLRYHDNGYNNYHEVAASTARAAKFRPSDMPSDPPAYAVSFYLAKRNSPGNLYVYLQDNLSSTSNIIGNYSAASIPTSYNWYLINLTSGNFSNFTDHYLIFKCPSCTSGSTSNNYRLGRDTNSLGNSSYYNNSGVWSITASSDYMATLYFNTTPLGDTNVSSGKTNTIGAYVDIGALSDDYEDGASGTAKINGTSYVELNYTLPSAVSYYGAVPYNVLVSFSGAAALTKQVDFNITDLPIYEAYFHPAQEYAYRNAAAAWNSPETTPTWTSGHWSPLAFEIFQSPTARNVPGSIYIPADRLARATTNHLITRDFDGSASNYILPNSTVDYTIFVPSQVPYGGVFGTEAAASADAISRLNATFNSYNLTGNFTIDTANIAGIKTMWGPSRIKVVIGS